MLTAPRISTTEMEVTSIRLERELKEKLKEMAGNQGYQALIRDVLWNYIQQKSGLSKACLSRSDIRAVVTATAQQEERCALTNRMIYPQETMLLGLTADGQFVPIHRSAYANIGRTGSELGLSGVTEHES
jgi:predicted DNA-binding protein